MPSRWTFTMQPVKELLAEEVSDPKMWCDPFAGHNSPAKWTNDINLEAKTLHHEDALDFLRIWGNNIYEGCLFDPPYSVEQAKRAYKYRGYGGSVGFELFIQQCKDEVARIVRQGGKVICFGWNSAGLGHKRGFKLVRGLIICHGGGGHRDTIVTVEEKL